MEEEEEEDCLRWKGGDISVISCRPNGLFVFAVLLLLLLLLLLSVLLLPLQHVHLQDCHPTSLLSLLCRISPTVLKSSHSALMPRAESAALPPLDSGGEEVSKCLSPFIAGGGGGGGPPTTRRTRPPTFSPGE